MILFILLQPPILSVADLVYSTPESSLSEGLECVEASQIQTLLQEMLSLIRSVLKNDAHLVVMTEQVHYKGFIAPGPRNCLGFSFFIIIILILLP